jgi:hypothetical protein
MTPSVLEKDLQRNWLIRPKKIYLFKHTQNPPRIVSLNRIIKGLLRTRPKGLEGVISNSMSTQRVKILDIDGCSHSKRSQSNCQISFFTTPCLL